MSASEMPPAPAASLSISCAYAVHVVEEIGAETPIASLSASCFLASSASGVPAAPVPRFSRKRSIARPLVPHSVNNWLRTVCVVMHMHIKDARMESQRVTMAGASWNRFFWLLERFSVA